MQTTQQDCTCRSKMSWTNDWLITGSIQRFESSSKKRKGCQVLCKVLDYCYMTKETMKGRRWEQEISKPAFMLVQIKRTSCMPVPINETEKADLQPFVVTITASQRYAKRLCNGWWTDAMSRVSIEYTFSPSTYSQFFVHGFTGYQVGVLTYLMTDWPSSLSTRITFPPKIDMDAQFQNIELQPPHVVR